MLKKTLLLVSVLAILMLAMPTDALAAAKKSVVIHNDTEEDVKVTFEGPETYKWTAYPGKYEKTFVEGEYEYSYTSCGEKHTGDFEINNNGQTFYIESCPAEEVSTKFVVSSHFGENLTVDLVGPEEYSLKVELGVNKFTDIIAGDYVYSYDACGITFSGIIDVQKNGKTQMTLKNCERLLLLDFEQPVPSKLRVANHFGSPVDITLIGPLTYYATLQPGLNRLDLVSGTYTYVYAANGIRYDGTFIVGKTGTSLVFIPTLVTTVSE